MRFSKDGYTFTDEHSNCRLLNEYAAVRGVHIKCFCVISDDGVQRSTILYNAHGEHVFESSSMDELMAHIDVMAQVEQ